MAETVKQSRQNNKLLELDALSTLSTEQKAVFESLEIQGCRLRTPENRPAGEVPC